MIRDEIAVELGWEKMPNTWWHREEQRYAAGHPIPDSADWLLEFWERELKGWSWWRFRRYWFAYRPADGFGSIRFEPDVQDAMRVPDTNNPKADLFALTLAVLRARKGI